MTDDQIQTLVIKEIKKRDITYYDMVGMPGHGVDPNPEDNITPPTQNRKINGVPFLVHGHSRPMRIS